MSPGIFLSPRPNRLCTFYWSPALEVYAVFKCVFFFFSPLPFLTRRLYFILILIAMPSIRIACVFIRSKYVAVHGCGAEVISPFRLILSISPSPCLSAYTYFDRTKIETGQSNVKLTRLSESRCAECCEETKTKRRFNPK